MKNIYPLIYDFENLYQAYRMAARGKRYRAEVLAFTAHLEENLITLQNELIHRTYAVGRYHEFFVYEPKKRLIMALPFRDRVVQWAIYRVIEPTLDRRMITDSYACRRGKGTHAAVDRLQGWLRRLDSQGEAVYAPKVDVAKYFYRIDHGVLLDILRRVIGCEDTLRFLERIIRCEHTEFGVPLGDHGFQRERISGIGIPIGNLTSQLFANLYLDQLDQFAKHALRLRHYIRYMDDIVILGTDKRELRNAQAEIAGFLKDRLRLDVNNKTGVRQAAGIEFCGYRIWPTHRKLRRSTVRKIKGRLRYLERHYASGEVDAPEIRATIQSYLGHLKHCSSYGLRRALLGRLRFRRSREV